MVLHRHTHLYQELGYLCNMIKKLILSKDQGSFAIVIYTESIVYIHNRKLNRILESKDGRFLSAKSILIHC
jgi:hypothetical protein